jgi:hypothetical protein
VHYLIVDAEVLEPRLAARIAAMMSDRMAIWAEAMRDGRYADGWALAAQTLAERNPATRDDPALPYHLRWVWDGRPVEGRHVLVRCYHGLGDTIQYARFLPLLGARAASVTLEVQPRLLDLFAAAMEGITFVAFDPERPLPPSEVDIDITELDFALRAAPDAVAPVYLRASPAVLPRRTIALCYGAGDWEPARSVPPSLLERLCRHAPCLTLMAEPTTLPVLNPDGCPFDIGATAALIAGAELVITVDTMVSHLAGALGKPTWLLLKHGPDWRWPNDGRRDSAWYPSMRLYHQKSPGDWAGVIADVEFDLTVRQLFAMEG